MEGELVVGVGERSCHGGLRLHFGGGSFWGRTEEVEKV